MPPRLPILFQLLLPLSLKAKINITLLLATAQELLFKYLILHISFIFILFSSFTELQAHCWNLRVVSGCFTHSSIFNLRL